MVIPGSKLPGDTQSGISCVIFSEIKWWQLSIIHGCASQKDKMGANNISRHSIKCNVSVIMMFKLSFAVRCWCLLLNKSMVTGLWMMDPQQISLSTTSMSTTTKAVSPVPLEEITCIESYSRVSRIYNLVLYWTQIIILLLPPLLYCLLFLIYFTARLLTKSFLVRVRLE